MENRTIFRKTSLERINNPEQLNDYIKINRPGIWLALSAIIILLIGVCVWGVFGTLTTVQDSIAVVENGTTTCYVSMEQAGCLKKGMEVTFNGAAGEILSVEKTPIQVDHNFDPYILYLGNLSVGDWVCPVNVKIDSPDGIFTAMIVTEQIPPISFVLN